MPSESESDDDLLEQAYGYKVNGTYPEGCTLNKQRSIRRKAKKLVLVNGDVRLKKKTKGTNESNGLDERFNQTLQRMLVKAITGQNELWDEFIDSAVFAYNTSYHESSCYAPFEVMFGREAVLPFGVDLKSVSPDKLLCTAVETDMAVLTSERQKVLKIVKSNILRAQEKQKQQYDAKHARVNIFQIGTEVFKKDFVRKKRKGGKLDPKLTAPSLHQESNFLGPPASISPQQSTPSASPQQSTPPASPQQSTPSAFPQQYILPASVL
ncbi:hypothetical protein EMCRGX_G015118 [Ephydatia muelleri]